jgi:hypothetical protein
MSMVKGGSLHRIGVYARAYGSVCELMLCYPDKALALGKEAVELANRIDHPYSGTIAVVCLAQVHQWRHDFGATRECANEAIEVSERLGFPGALALGRLRRGWSRAVAGDADGGISEIEQMIAFFQRSNCGYGMPLFYAYLGESLKNAKRSEDALLAIDMGTSVARTTGQHCWDGELFRLQGEILLVVPAGPTVGRWSDSLSDVNRWNLIRRRPGSSE